MAALLSSQDVIEMIFNVKEENRLLFIFILFTYFVARRLAYNIQL